MGWDPTVLHIEALSCDVTTDSKALEGVSENEDTDSQEKYSDDGVAQTLSVNDINHRLFRFACSIHDHTTRSVQRRRNTYSTSPTEGRQHIVDRLVEIETLRFWNFFIHLHKQDFDGFVGSEKEIALGGDDMRLIERFASVNSRRRQRFVY
jgi:hypothetical protein